MSVLLQKGEHDDQLLATLTTQLRAAEEALRDRRSQHEVALQKVEDRRSQLEDQVAAHREQVNHLSVQLAERDKLVEQLKLRLERAEPPRVGGSELDSPRRSSRAAAHAGGASAASCSSCVDARASLQAAEAERLRLLELVAVLHSRLDEREQTAAEALDRWRTERARAARMETKVERLELERQSLVKVGCYRGAATKKMQQLQLNMEERQRLELLEEECALLRTRIDALRREKAEDRAKYLTLLQQSSPQIYASSPSESLKAEENWGKGMGRNSSFPFGKAIPVIVWRDFANNAKLEST